MILALQDDTSRPDAGRSLYGRSKARLPTGPASWPTRRGTCPIMVLTARCGRWLLPTSWPAWPAYNVCLPDTCRRYRLTPWSRDRHTEHDAEDGPGSRIDAVWRSTEFPFAWRTRLDE